MSMAHAMRYRTTKRHLEWMRSESKMRYLYQTELLTAPFSIFLRVPQDPPARAMTKLSSVHIFTAEFPDKDYQATTESTHVQTKFWPAYLPVNDDRLFIFERSKNAQLVVYTANYADREKRLLDAKNPLDINWQSFGWTSQPTSNPTGMVERRMAWGYSHKATDGTAIVGASYGSQYNVTLNALPSRAAVLYFDAKGRLMLQTTINGTPSRLWKVYVCTNNTMAFIPKVLYVDLYGTSVENGQDTHERIVISA